MDKMELVEYLENHYKDFLLDKVQDCYIIEVSKSFDEIIEIIKKSKN